MISRVVSFVGGTHCFKSERNACNSMIAGNTAMNNGGGMYLTFSISPIGQLAEFHNLLSKFV